MEKNYLDEWENPNVDDKVDEMREEKFERWDKIHKIRVMFYDSVESLDKKLTKDEVNNIYELIKRFFE